MSTPRRLAQVNIGRLRFPKGDPRVQPFFDALDRVNAVADRFDGFVWRLKDDSGHAMDIAFPGESGMNVNLSVWESVEALQRYVFQTVHAGAYRKRADWFVKLDRPHFAMWWIDKGHVPTLGEAADKLAELERDGPSDSVFTWAETPAAGQWRAARCA